MLQSQYENDFKKQIFKPVLEMLILLKSKLLKIAQANKNLKIVERNHKKKINLIGFASLL